MAIIHPKGSPSSRVWVVCEAPLSTDLNKGYLFSGGMGYVFDKMMSDACIKDYYITCRRPDPEHPEVFHIVENDLNHYKPPFIIVMGASAAFFLEALKKENKQKSHITQLGKYVGSLLRSPLLSYDYYMMPMYDMLKFAQDWSERNITTYFDMQKLREEYYYWLKHGSIQPLPERELHYKEMTLDEILNHFSRFNRASILSVDIETCYPKGTSVFKEAGHPGYPITIGIADSPSYGVSFNLFRDSPSETRILWRELNELLKSKPNLGQNYFNFDSHFLKALGFEINLFKIKDTLIRHHILWPELPHKLQFQTRQYTREPYYKDEGHSWNLKNMAKLRRYNCLDVCITMEIYLNQEDEFRERKEVA